MMAEAVQLASEADVVIAIVGLNADWESEGYDRKTLALPGRTDELITKVVAANPKTIVVTQSVRSIASSRHVLTCFRKWLGLIDNVALGGCCSCDHPLLVPW